MGPIEIDDDPVISRLVEASLSNRAKREGRSRTTTVNLVLLVPRCFSPFLSLPASGRGACLSPPVLRSFLHPSQAGEAGEIIFALRLPRVLAAALVGAALSATGVLFQGLFRNPLADPFVLGTSGGAAIGGAIGIFLVPTLSFRWIGAAQFGVRSLRAHHDPWCGISRAPAAASPWKPCCSLVSPSAPC